jgi:hypothetical protein
MNNKSLIVKLASYIVLSGILLLGITTRAQATIWAVNVVKINSYAGASGLKYIFVTNGIGSACPYGALTFDGTGDGGKALYALFLIAIATGKGGNGCNILEAYIRA